LRHPKKSQILPPFSLIRHTCIYSQNVNKDILCHAKLCLIKGNGGNMFIILLVYLIKTQDPSTYLKIAMVVSIYHTLPLSLKE